MPPSHPAAAAARRFSPFASLSREVPKWSQSLITKISGRGRFVAGPPPKTWKVREWQDRTRKKRKRAGHSNAKSGSVSWGCLAVLCAPCEFVRGKPDKPRQTYGAMSYVDVLALEVDEVCCVHPLYLHARHVVIFLRLLSCGCADAARHTAHCQV